MAIHNGIQHHSVYLATQKVSLKKIPRQKHSTNSEAEQKNKIAKNACLILDNRVPSCCGTSASLRAACLKTELPGTAILSSLNLVLPVNISWSSPWLNIIWQRGQHCFLFIPSLRLFNNIFSRGLISSFLPFVPPDCLFQSTEVWLSCQVLGETAMVHAYLRFTILSSVVFWGVFSPVIQLDRSILLPTSHFISRISNPYCKHSKTS